MTAQHTMFNRYEAAVRTYAGDPCATNLLMAQEGPLSVYYSPFEWVNPRAQLVLVGITPGKVQAANALGEAQRCLSSNSPIDEVLRKAKQTGAFSGAMRPNLVALLDSIGIAKWLEISSCEELFGRAADRMQTASVLQYPVFLNRENYNGTPDIVKTPLLQRMLLEHFGAMVKRLPDAVFVPLGPVPTKALAWLCQKGHISRGRALEGLPHPSGANAERIAYFLGKKPKAALSTKTDPIKLDCARERLLAAVAAL